MESARIMRALVAVAGSHAADVLQTSRFRGPDCPRSLLGCSRAKHPGYARLFWHSDSPLLLEELVASTNCRALIDLTPGDGRMTLDIVKRGARTTDPFLIVRSSVLEIAFVCMHMCLHMFRRICTCMNKHARILPHVLKSLRTLLSVIPMHIWQSSYWGLLSVIRSF